MPWIFYMMNGTMGGLRQLKTEMKCDGFASYIPSINAIRRATGGYNREIIL